MGKRPIIELIPTWDSPHAVCMVCLLWSISVQNTGRARFPIDSPPCWRGVDYLPGIGIRRYLSSARRTWLPEGSPLLISGKWAVFRSGAYLLARLWPPKEAPAAGRPQSGENEGDPARHRALLARIIPSTKFQIAPGRARQRN